jgi:hypothetical protein
MKLYRATEAIDVPYPVITIYSDPGAGKTTLGYSADRALLLDFDRGIHRAKNRRETLQPETWQDVEDLLAKPEQFLSQFGKTIDDFGTFVVDTGGRCLDLLALDVIRKNPKHGTGGSLNLQGWGQLKTRFAAFKNRLQAMDKALVILCHGKEDKDGDLRTMRPDVQGASLGEILKSSDVIGYMHTEGSQRILDFSPTDRWTGKNPGGWPTIKVPEYAQAQDFLAGIQQKAREALGAMSEESAAVAREVDGFREMLKQTNGLKNVNTLLKSVETLRPVVRAQVKRPLHEHATALGFTFDKTKGEYVKEQIPAAAQS